MLRILSVGLLVVAVAVFACVVPAGTVSAGGVDVREERVPAKAPSVDRTPKMPEWKSVEEPVEEEAQRPWVWIFVGFVAAVFLSAL